MGMGTGMGMRVLVVDDEALARSRLRSLLGDCGADKVQQVDEAANANAAIAAIQEQPCDLVLLDIHMPGMDGLKLAALLRELPEPPALVFVTAHAEHALQAFELEALDYLTKPVRLERLQQMLQKVERQIEYRRAVTPQKDQNFLLLQDRGRTERLPVNDVLYFKAELKYVTVRTAAKAHIYEASLSELEQRFGEQFLRIHRNALVSRQAMRALERHDDAVEGEGWAVRLHGVDDALAVSRRQLSAVRAAIAAV